MHCAVILGKNGHDGSTVQLFSEKMGMTDPIRSYFLKNGYDRSTAQLFKKKMGMSDPLGSYFQKKRASRIHCAVIFETK